MRKGDVYEVEHIGRVTLCQFDKINETWTVEEELPRGFDRISAEFLHTVAKKVEEDV